MVGGKLDGQWQPRTAYHVDSRQYRVVEHSHKGIHKLGRAEWLGEVGVEVE